MALSDFALRRVQHELNAIAREIAVRVMLNEKYCIYTIYKASLTKDEFNKFTYILVTHLHSLYGLDNVKRVNCGDDTRPSLCTLRIKI